MAWEPGNPKGWGDPSPLVLAIMLLVILGAVIDRYSNFLSSRDQCQQILEQYRRGQ